MIGIDFSAVDAAGVVDGVDEGMDRSRLIAVFGVALEPEVRCQRRQVGDREDDVDGRGGHAPGGGGRLVDADPTRPPMANWAGAVVLVDVALGWAPDEVMAYTAPPMAATTTTTATTCAPIDRRRSRFHDRRQRRLHDLRVPPCCLPAPSAPVPPGPGWWAHDKASEGACVVATSKVGAPWTAWW